MLNPRWLNDFLKYKKINIKMGTNGGEELVHFY
jgi:hypothetical protein